MRKWIVILLFILFSQIAFYVFLMPSIISVFFKEKETNINFQMANESASFKSANLITSVVNSVNFKLSFFKDKMDYLGVVSILDKVLVTKSDAIKLENISYNSDSKSDSTLNLQGIADSREDLVSFSKRLQAINSIKSVDLPVSNLAKDKNLVFSITLKISSSTNISNK